MVLGIGQQFLLMLPSELLVDDRVLGHANSIRISSPRDRVDWRTTAMTMVTWHPERCCECWVIDRAFRELVRGGSARGGRDHRVTDEFLEPSTLHQW
jgi:hypothetical protein